MSHEGGRRGLVIRRLFACGVLACWRAGVLAGRPKGPGSGPDMRLAESYWRPPCWEAGVCVCVPPGAPRAPGLWRCWPQYSGTVRPGIEDRTGQIVERSNIGGHGQVMQVRSRVLSLGPRARRLRSACPVPNWLATPASSRAAWRCAGERAGGRAGVQSCSSKGTLVPAPGPRSAARPVSLAMARLGLAGCRRQDPGSGAQERIGSGPGMPCALAPWTSLPHMAHEAQGSGLTLSVPFGQP